MNNLEHRFVRRLNRAFSRKRVILSDPDLKPAAVLVPIVFRNSEPHLILTRRTMNVTSHKGQISFPGGASEPEDKDVADTALRETQEEIGVLPESIDLIGEMDDFSTISGYLVTPVVGLVPHDATFDIDDNEVDEMFEEPLTAFQDPAVHELITVDHDGTLHEYHSYEIGPRVVWGATAGIIYRLLTLLETPGAQ